MDFLSLKQKKVSSFCCSLPVPPHISACFRSCISQCGNDLCLPLRQHVIWFIELPPFSVSGSMHASLEVESSTDISLMQMCRHQPKPLNFLSSNCVLFFLADHYNRIQCALVPLHQHLYAKHMNDRTARTLALEAIVALSLCHMLLDSAYLTLSRLLHWLQQDASHF